MCRDVQGLKYFGFNSDKIGVGLEKYIIIQKYLYTCNEGGIGENIES